MIHKLSTGLFIGIFSSLVSHFALPTQIQSEFPLTISNRSLIEVSHLAAAVKPASVRREDLKRNLSIQGIPAACHLDLIEALREHAKTADKDSGGYWNSWINDEYYKLFKAYLQTGDYGDAWQLVNRNSDYQASEVILALAKRGKLAEAQQYIQKAALEFHYEDDRKQILLMQVYAMAGQPDKALSLLKSLTKFPEIDNPQVTPKLIWSNRVELMAQISASFFKTGQPEAGEQLYQRILQTLQVQPPAFQQSFGMYSPVEMYIEVGELDQALRAAEGPMKDDGKRGMALLEIAKAYISRQDISAALPILQQVEDISLTFQEMERKAGYPPARPNRPSYAPVLMTEYILAYARAGEYDHALNLVGKHDRRINQDFVPVEIAQEAVKNGRVDVAEQIMTDLESQLKTTTSGIELELPHSKRNIQLANIYRAIGQFDKAQLVLKNHWTQLQNKPMDATGKLPYGTQSQLYDYVKYYLSMGDLKNAKQVAKKMPILSDLVSCVASNLNLKKD